MKHEDVDTLNSRKTQQWAIFSVAAFFLFFGVPIWWKTTDVYRAHLPYTEVSKLLSEKTFIVTVLVEVQHDESLNDNDISNLLSVALNKERNISLSNSYSQKHNITFQYIVTLINDVGVFREVQENALKVKFKTTNADINHPFYINIMDHSDHTINCLITETADDTIVNDAVEAVSHQIKYRLVNENVNEELVQNVFQSSTRQQNTQNIKKMFSTSASMELLFSLLVPVSETGIKDWDIKQAVHQYLNPFLSRLFQTYDFKIGSQILYANTVSFHTTKKKDEHSGLVYTALKENQLSSIVNSIENRLGSQLSSDPSINFVVYVVEEKHRPLHLVKNPDKVSKSNIFFVPRWGAMSFYNPPYINESAVSHDLSVLPIMPFFIANLRTLLGLDNNVILEENSKLFINYETPEKYGISDWECQFLFRLRTLENMAKTVHTLDSLFQLLNRIHNIVINDNVAREIYQSMNSINEAKYFMQSGNLKAALNSSRTAFSSSETAFFDASLLELLYFPQDQKFAIYIPLFVPIGLPIILSVLLALKRHFKSEQGVKLKDE